MEETSAQPLARTVSLSGHPGTGQKTLTGADEGCAEGFWGALATPEELESVLSVEILTREAWSANTES